MAADAPRLTAELKFQYDDGGRAAAGRKGKAPGDCVTRAISIATGLSYNEAYRMVNEAGSKERTSKKRTGKSTARTGVYKPTIRRLFDQLGWVWTPTMKIGTGCTTHMRADELPRGRLVVAVSRHVSVVIDHVVYDTHDPTRDGKRCVYGYWQPPKEIN